MKNLGIRDLCYVFIKFQDIFNLFILPLSQYIWIIYSIFFFQSDENVLLCTGNLYKLVKCPFLLKVGEVCLASSPYLWNEMPAMSIYLLSYGIEQGPLYVLQFSNISLRAPEQGISSYTGQWEFVRMRLLPKTYALFVTLSLSLYIYIYKTYTDTHTKTLYFVVVIKL
jgi:hypothetical protein